MTTEVPAQHAAGVAARTRRPVRRIAAQVAVAAASAGLVVAVPGLLRTTWRDIWSLLAAVPVWWLVLLSVVWIAGLLAHTLVLSASLPGLSARRALALNLAGSAVANAVPLGGAVSMGLTGKMVRSWGFRPTAIGAFFTVSNVWNVTSRGLLGLLGIAWWMTRPGSAHPVVLGAALAPVLAVLAVFFAVLWSERAATWVAGLAGRVSASVRRRNRTGELDVRERVTATITSVRRSSLRIARRSWPALSAGMIGYTVLLFVLLDLCLRALGSPQSVATVVAVVCLERLLTAVPLTPGSVGVAELGVAGSLVLAGVDPVVAAGVAVLYRLYTFGLEIPVGLVVASAWGLARRASLTRPLATAGGRP